MHWFRNLSQLDKAVIFAAFVAVLAASPIGQAIAIAALISLIGLPIYFILIILPTLFLILLAVRFAVGIWTNFSRRRLGRAAAFTLALLAISDFYVFRAWRVNSWLEHRAGALTSADKDNLGPAKPIGTLAILRNTRTPGDDGNWCDDLCARLLLTGSVKEVLMLTAAPPPQPRTKVGDPPPEWPPLEPISGSVGTAWRIEAREICSNTGAQKIPRPIQMPQRPQAGRTLYMPPPRTEELIRLRIASGHCLEKRPMALSDVDAIFAYGVVRSGASAFTSGYDAWTDTLSAWRIEFWRRQGGRLVEEYRRTGIVMELFPGALVHNLLQGAQLTTHAGWLRTTKLLNQTLPEREPVFVDFLTQRLRLKLEESSGADAVAEKRDLRTQQAIAIDRILASPAAPTGVDTQLISDYLVGISAAGFNRTGRVDEAEASRILKIVQDRRVPLPREASSAIRFGVEQHTLDEPSVAGALIERLRALPQPTTENAARTLWDAQLNAVTSSLAMLPSSVLTPYRSDAVALMQNRDRRMVAKRFLERLDLYGPEILPDIFAMMDDAAFLQQTPDLGGLNRTWSDVWRAGASSICRFGSRTPVALDGLRTREKVLKDRKLNAADTVVAAAMLRMGATEDDVRETLGVDKSSAEQMRSFGFLVQRATRSDACL